MHTAQLQPHLRRPIHARTMRFGRLHPPGKHFQVIASGAWKPKPVSYPYTQKVTRLGSP